MAAVVRSVAFCHGQTCLEFDSRLPTHDPRLTTRMENRP